MAEPHFSLGLDFGTSSIRALVVSVDDGREVGDGRRSRSFVELTSWEGEEARGNVARAGGRISRSFVQIGGENRVEEGDIEGDEEDSDSQES